MSTGPPPPPPRGSSEVTSRKTQQWRRVEFSEEHQHSTFQSSRYRSSVLLITLSLYLYYALCQPSVCAPSDQNLSLLLTLRLNLFKRHFYKQRTLRKCAKHVTVGWMDEYNGDGRQIISFVAISIYNLHYRTIFERGEVKQNFSSSATKQSVASRWNVEEENLSDFICFPANRIFQQIVCFRTSSKSLVTFSSGGPGTCGGGKPVARVSPGNI